MTAPISWHVREEDLQGYSDGSTPAPAAMSIEAHMVTCAACRSRLRDHVPLEPLEAIWRQIEDSVQVPPTPRIHRLLRHIGFTPSDMLLLAAAPALRAAWVMGTCIVLTFPLLAVGLSTGHGITAFLLIAPLAPIAGVAFAYGSDADQTHELGVASPYPAARLLLVRTLAVIAFCLPLAATAGLLLPGPRWLAVAWLLPAAAAVVAILAASTWVSTTRAATVVGVAWALVVTVTSERTSALVLVEGRVLILYAVALGTGVLVFHHRAHLLT